MQTKLLNVDAKGLFFYDFFSSLGHSGIVKSGRHIHHVVMA